MKAMKKNIKTLEDALAFLLDGLLSIEKRAGKEFTMCSAQITSSEVRSEIQRYIERGEEKILKLNRLFSYLMREPSTKRNEVIEQMLLETHHLLEYAVTADLKDTLMISCIQKINAYKLSSYRTAYRFAVALDLDTPSEILFEIIQWEVQTSELMAELSIRNFSKSTGNLAPS